MGRGRGKRVEREIESGKKPAPILSTIWPEDGLCPLCGRELIEGPSVNDHHLVPRSRGGKEKHALHKVCHSKIHSVFTENELAQVYNTFEKLREHDEIKKFVKWVRKQPPERIVINRRLSNRH